MRERLGSYFADEKTKLREGKCTARCRPAGVWQAELRGQLSSAQVLGTFHYAAINLKHLIVSHLFKKGVGLCARVCMCTHNNILEN